MLSLNASSLSGLGDSTELKFGSKSFCFSKILTSAPISHNAGSVAIAPVPWMGVKRILGQWLDIGSGLNTASCRLAM